MKFREIFLQVLFMEQMQQANRTSGEQHAVQVTEQVRALLLALSNEQLSLEELMGIVGLKHRPTFLENYIWDNTYQQCGIFCRISMKNHIFIDK